jgi:CheY-like chemotaxis protein
VKDTGVGIAPNMLSRIFELFTQAQPFSILSKGGLGVGLTLVRSLVELHEGTVEGHSGGLGQGSEFIVRLPLPAIPAEMPQPRNNIPEKKAQPAAARRILVVDDNVDAAQSLAMLLRFDGQQVWVAHDGPSGLKLATECQPEVAILDIGMPGMDGYDLARRLRQCPGGDGLLLIALTGWGQEADRCRSHEAGFDHHLTKPVEPTVLQGLLVGQNSS